MAYCTIGTAGHVDHGKTALVKALTGVDTDSLAEERRRGLSIELGFAHFEAPDSGGALGPLHISIIDVPGHEKFIRTMLAGTTGIDMVLFVVAADDGVMPQSREHLDIVRLLNVESAVFVISKVDRVDGQRVGEVKGDIEALIKGTNLEGSPFLSTSSTTGEGIEELREKLVEMCAQVKARERGPYFRLPIDRSFTIKGFGTVVTGTIASGTIHKNDTVSAFTEGANLPGIRVRGIESTHQKVESAGAGSRCALNLTNASQGALKRGAILAETRLVDFVSDGLKLTSVKPAPMRMDCAFEFLSSIDESRIQKIMKKSLKLFHLTGESLASVRFPGKNDISCGRLTLSSPLVCLRGDYVILRDTATNATVGGARVLMPYYNPRLAGSIAKTDYRSLKGTDASEILSALVGPREVGLKLAGLEYMLNLPTPDIIKDAESFVHSGEFLLKSDRCDALKDRLTAILKAFHGENPSKEGLSISALVKLLAKDGAFSFRLAGAGLIQGIVEEMITGGGLVRSASLISLATHSPSLSEVDKDIEEALVKLFCTPLTMVKSEQLFALPFKRAEIEGVLSYLLSKGRIVKIKDAKFLLGEEVEEARSKLEHALRALAQIPVQAGADEQGITVSEYRDLLGTGRKIAIEILEYFDRELVTLRRGDYRVLRGGALKGRDDIA
ncbi:MAG: selenocysteine-specific translation elongation factor [Proteobacteria bacterium]|nr:selenocysteine-specific translation elongation factor [Pseudomonadota bacterium]